ncbi:probable chitinase 2 [Uranotaenia lowii]|uniref:probable chitinase 2 n=1 Tax=Uranotaenia lowii TaxID=190385 RepID=UPI00247AC293|nr:probable chitinase 2 [Uranotaenia lowii]
MQLILAFILILPYSVIAEICNKKSYNVVCYLASWSVYREGKGAFNVSYVVPDYCTHLVYTFAGLNLAGGIDSLDYYNDINVNKGYEKIVELKEDNPCLQIMLAVGGWNEGSEKYSLMAESEDTRKLFADQALKFLSHFGFDGLDLDWEYPTQRGGIPEDRENFVLLLEELKEKFQRRKKLLTVAIGGSTQLIQQAYNVSALCSFLDFVNLMGYDYKIKDKTSLDAPIYPEAGQRTESIDEAVAYLRKNGCPPSKIVLGITTMAKTYTLRPGNVATFNTGVTVQGPGKPGPFTKSAGSLGYNELCEQIITNKWSTKILPMAGVMVGYHGDQWATFEDAKTVGMKARYVRDKGLGGIMFWTVDTDDFHGDCNNEAYPLLLAANRVFGYAS